MLKSGYRDDIDGLRMVAVLPVVFSHADVPGFDGGYVGVDIFFVISGFLITGILVREIEADEFSIIRFYERRARRILPALFVVLAACLIGGWWLLSPERYDALGKSVVATLAFVSNMWFWYGAGDYFSPAVELEPLLHTWSLAVEEQFYILFPLVLWVVAALGRTLWVPIIAGLVALSFALSVWMTNAEPSANFYFVVTRAWELGFGSLLALGAFKVSRSAFLNEASGILGLFLILGSIFLLEETTPFPGLTAAPAVLGATLIIYAGMGRKALVCRLLTWRPFVWIGLISYSLYLWHWPVLIAARTMQNTVHLSPGSAVACILLSIALAWISWRFVERPFRVAHGSRAFTRLRIFQWAGVGALTLALAGAVVSFQDGFVGQFPKDRVDIYKTASQRAPLEVKCMNRPANDPCLLGVQTDVASIAIWGDSHAGAALAGFDEWLLAAEESAIVYAKSACPPLFGVYRADQRVWHQCDQYNSEVLAHLMDASAIDTVVLFSRWSLMTEGVRPENELGPPALLAATGEPSQGIADNARLVERGLDELVRGLSSRDVDVLIIAGTPEIGLNVPELVLRYGEEVPDHLIVTKETTDQRNLRADEIIGTVAARYGGEILEPRPLICEVNCLLQVDGQPLYRDDDHLSAYGARWLIPQLMSAYR